MTEQVREPIQNCKAPADHLLKVVDLGPPQQPQKKTDGNTAFLRAARSGNLEKVLEFINANVDINTSNSNGLNALHLASKDGHVEVAAELLKRGANVDAATKKGNTALHIASLAGQEEVVKLLIEHGASVNLQSQSGFTPLYMAAQENHERVVRYLLNNGANQSLATEDGFTPLAVAMQQGHDKVVTELLENDTRGKIKLPALHIAAKKDDCKAAALLLQSEHNPDITSKSGFTPLHIASHYGNDAIASLLLAKGADVNYAAKHNITPLHVAAKWGRNNMVILLLDKGASIIAKTRDGLTPLHCAARSGHEQVVDTLLQRHAPITAKTKNGLAPLHMASQGDHVEAARVLLAHRAPVDDVTVDYLTALHVASHCGHVSVAKLLLDRKADPNARALNGFTPLHIACKKNRVKIVELLLKHGGSIEATTESGLSPLHVASFMGCMNIVIYLLQCGANPDVSTIRGETPLHLASRANQTDIIRILLRNNAQVDAKAREQQTPLHIASRLGNIDIVMLLLQHGANVDSVTKDLYTSLHIAAKEDQEEVAQALLEHNASMTATTKKGFTPLHLAAKYGRTNIATLLLQRGAPVDAQGKNGVTPLHVASHYDHQGIALLLLDKGASPHATAKNGHTPLHIAAKKNQMDIAAMLVEYGANAGAESKAGFTPLHLSAQEGHVDMTNLLLEHKADVNHSSKNGLTPLHLCAQEDCVDVATILVKNGADVNSVTKAGYTPLHIASHFGQLNMVRFLLSNKAKVDTATSTGYTPLHQAAQQGNSAIVAVLLDNGASPDTKNNQGQTALCIAQKLGYISVVEVLKNVTDNSKATSAAAPAGEEKYKVVAPETMQENFMSDSEDEGGEDATNEQSYRYLTIDEMKSLGDDSLPIDTSKEDRYDTTAGIDESISPQHTFNQLSAAPVIDNVDVIRAPVVQTGKLKWKSFLVSFLVDAKGGAMRGCRHSGVRVIVPPQCVTMPTRVTCRYVRRDKPNHPPPPPLMEGEALASRILELGPVGVKFLGPVVIEVPNFAALRGNEREIVILRSDNGETWREHTVDSSNDAVHDILSRSFDKDGNQIPLDEPGRITSIVTHDFPHYFAIVSRIRQEVHAIGPEGGMVSSSVVPQVQAVFPQGALTKKIKVGLQAQPIPSELTAAVLGNCVAVSPIVTIEPRRRKFHKPITLTLPVPQAANKGMINQYSGDAPTLRLLCSITGGTSRAQWEDVTGSTPLTFVKECVSFTTTVSARFWLMDIRDIAVATKKATELYREAIHIPFMAKFVVFAKRIDNNEARLRVFCMTDDKEDKTLESQEQFTEVAKSRDVEVLEGKKQLIELSGNLISVTKSGDQLKLGFNAFQENRLPFTVRIKDSLADPIGRMLFFKEQKPVKTSTPHPPICVLNIVLPETIIPDSDFADSPIRKYYLLNDTQGYHRSELKFSDISNLIGEDWEALAEKLGIRSSECQVIKIEHPESTARQSLVMLKQWHQRAGTKATANILESALLSIGREDIVQECFLNTTQQKIPNGNGLISHKIEDIHGKKNDVYSTDDDERKYTAEEKIIDETELKSVSERKKEIEKRLIDEQNNKKEIFKERSESEEKRQLSSKQQSEEREIIKNVVHDEKDIFEPTKLTFQQKRLSFEKGYSVDKILSEGIAQDGEPVQVAVIEEPHDKSSKRGKSVEKDLPPKTEKSVEKAPQKEPSVEKSTLKTDEPICQKPPRKDKQEEEKKHLPKEKSAEKVSEKLHSQKEKSPETPVKKESIESKAVDKLASEKTTEKAVVKEKSVEKVTETFISKEKSVEEKVTEKPAQKDKPVQEKVAEKVSEKDESVKENVEKPLPKKNSKEKFVEDKVYEKPLSKDKSEEKIAEKFIQKEITIEKKISDKPVQKEKSIEEKASVQKEEKIIQKLSQKEESPEKQPSKDKSPEPQKPVTKEKSLEKDSSQSKPATEEKPAEKEEKPLSFLEKRLSFEQGTTSTVISSQTTEIKLQNDLKNEQDTAKEKRDSDARRDSELFEGVTLGLGKLEAKPIPLEQNFLSPKPIKTPPPSPAEFKESNEEWHKTDSLDSNRSNKSVAEIDTPLSENLTATSTESAEPTHSRFANERSPSVNNLNEDSVQKLPIPEHSFENITTESVSEIEEPTPLRIRDDSHDKHDKSEQEKYTDQLIEMLIAQETAQLVASGRISYDSDSDEEIRKKYESFKPNGQSTVVEFSDDENNQHVAEISDSDVELLKYLSTAELKDENHIASDHSTERSPQRKVAFRLNSDENELVYPGQTDSEESTSNSENSENSENSDDAPEPGANDEENHIDEKSPPKEEIKIINTQPTEVERKFERMASETLDDVGKVEGEFHKIVSQLSFEEVTDCLNAWDETESAAKHEIGEKPVRHEGDKQLSSTESDTRPPSQVLESDTDNQDNMDYFSKKRFWQSFESAGPEKSASAPVPKPRSSISSATSQDEIPIAAKRSTENIRSGFTSTKSESLQERHSDVERFRPSMKKVHSLTSYSTDSEAEYIANCGIEKLAYENVAFSEEDESISEAQALDMNGVKAKKMFFEQMQKDSSQESVTSPTARKDENIIVKTTEILSSETRVDKVDGIDPKGVTSPAAKKDANTHAVETIKETRIEQTKDSHQQGVTSPPSKEGENTGIITTTRFFTTQTRIDREDDSSQKNVIKKEESTSVVKTIKETLNEKTVGSRKESAISSHSKKDENTDIVETTQVFTTETRIDKVDDSSVPIKKDKITDVVTTAKKIQIEKAEDSSQKSITGQSIKKDENIGTFETIKETLIEKTEGYRQESVTSLPSKKDESTGIVKTTHIVTTETRIDKADDSSSKSTSSLPVKKGEITDMITSAEKVQIEKVEDSSKKSIAGLPVEKDEITGIQKSLTSPPSKKDESTDVVKTTQGVTTETRIDKKDDSNQKSIAGLPVEKDEITCIQKSLTSPSKKDENTVIVKTAQGVTTETRIDKADDSRQKSIASLPFKKDENTSIVRTTHVVTTETRINKLDDSSVPIKKDEITDVVTTTKKIQSPPSKKDESTGTVKAAQVVTTETRIHEADDFGQKSITSLPVEKDEIISSQKSFINPPLGKDENTGIVKTTQLVTTETRIDKADDSSPKSISSLPVKKGEITDIITSAEKVQIEKVEDSSQKSLTSPPSKKYENIDLVKTTDTQIDKVTVSSQKIASSPPPKADDTVTKVVASEPQIDKVDSNDDFNAKSATIVETRTNGSLDESADSTQSESDITPEDLRDKQFLMQDWESTNEMLENIAHEKERLSICYSERPIEHQIRFSESEEYKLFNDIRSVSQEEYVDEALKEEVKVAAENLINEIEEELGKRPDIVECLLKSKLEELVDEIATSSNDITDEDLKSTGTETDIPMLYGQEETPSAVDIIESKMKMKISEASPTEYEIKYEQVEEFNILESVDFEEQIIPEEAESSLRSTSESFTAVCKNEIVKPSRIPIRSGKSADVKSPPQRKSSEDEKSRTSTSPEYVQDFIEIRQTKNRKSGADFEPCSSSSESHYHSFEHSGTASRPLSSDVEGLLSCNVPGTTGSSEYETAASHDTSHDFHTAMSSASLPESIKSIDSESSGNLGSAEVSSEVSETLVASSAELEHDVDLPTSHYYDETKKSVFRRSPVEPYDNEIPIEIIKGTSHSFDMSHLHSFASEQKKAAEPGLSGHVSVRESHEIDDKLLSSSEDVSSFSITDGGSTNLQTVIEVNSTESDKMDNSLISEQSLTMSAASNQFSTSSSDFKDEVETDKKNADTNTTTQTHETYSNVSIITSTCQEHGRTNVCTQVTSKIDKSDSKDTISRDMSAEDIPNITISQHSTPPKETILEESPVKDAPISPDSESFELIEQPDMMDDFVIVEEVAKEAFEQDQEGKSIRITEKRKPKNYDDEVHNVPPKTTSTLTKVEYYGGNDGCNFPIEDVPNEDKPSTDEEYESSPPNDGELYEHEVEEGKKWIEMQFQTDSEDAAAYDYNYERVPLEDIKEEDTDEMHSSKIGSVSSQISQSIGSLGSMKQSLSSTPDYDILAGKRYFTKSSDKDDVSQGSLQEFERLEQLMALESMKSKLSGSQDSLGSSISANGKKKSGDDISVSSLKEFEGLEYACVEAEKIEERAQAEERMLSQIEEGHESQASESESCETLEKSCYAESDDDEDYDQKMFEIDEIIRQAQSNVEKFADVDRLEKTESLGRGDSFEETARIPDFELDQPLTENTHSSSEIYSGKKYIEHIDVSHSLTTSTDSLEPKCKPEDILVTSTDSLEATTKSKQDVVSDSLECTRVESPRSAYDADEELNIAVGSDCDSQPRLSPHHLMLSSPDSLDATSSAGTHATYQNETDSAMSSSFTSAGSNTMVSSTENLENIVTNYSNWLDGNPYMTEVVCNISEKSYVTTERVAETPTEVKITSQGQDAKKLYDKDMAAFKPGEYYTETQEIDSEGNIHIKRVIESRAVVTSEKVQNTEKIILNPEEYRSSSDVTVSHFVTRSNETFVESGIKTETTVRQEKKEVSGNSTSDKTKS